MKIKLLAVILFFSGIAGGIIFYPDGYFGWRMILKPTFWVKIGALILWFWADIREKVQKVSH